MTIYDFPEIDDILPMHTHVFHDNHMTIVARGKVLIRTDKWEKEAPAGMILDWEPGQPHEFIGIEPNSRVVNILKNV